jgi:energy-coupling factor transporter ATP-binding protein EcfA2
MTINKSISGAPARPTYIRHIRIERLFGYLDYDIPNKVRDGTDFDRLMILYGDNGSGKTTILTLVFCLLSPQIGKGEKTYVARTPFKNLIITFNDGSCVSATRENAQLSGSYTVLVSQPNALTEEFSINANADGLVPRDSEGAKKLLLRLAKLDIGLYFLADDRSVRATLGSNAESEEMSEDPTPARAWSTYATSVALARRVQLEVGGQLDPQRGSHHLNIAPVLDKLNTWFREHVYLGSSAGEENATSIYLRVIEQIAMLAGSRAVPRVHAKSTFALPNRITKLSKRIEAFSRFGLITPFPATKFLDAFHKANEPAKRTIATVIEPYIDGIEARLNALDQVRAVILTYVETINEFLTGKTIHFSLQTGAIIRGYHDASLDPALLSSGEKQLVLILSNTILARDAAGIFLIDEPELSLNVKWQRSLVTALLKCSEGSSIQYILASHSLELITQHRPNAVRLFSSAMSGHA